MEIIIKKEDVNFVESQLQQEFELVKKSIESLSEKDGEGAGFYRRIIRELHTLFFERRTSTNSEVLLNDYEKKLGVLYRKNTGNYMQLVVLNSNISSFNNALELAFAKAEIYGLAFYYFEAEKINNDLFAGSVAVFFKES